MTAAQVRGTLPQIIRNDEGLYEGSLSYYFCVLFNHAKNLELPYHNFRHMAHVMWLCYAACRFYRGTLSARQMRNLLVAAMFHDFNHSGRLGNDALNIERAIGALRTHAAEEDRASLDEIATLIRATEYPFVVPEDKLDLCGQILRDADVSQALSVAWIQQVVFGLASEGGKRPIDVLHMQEPFLKGLAFRTQWARQQFPQSDVDAKIEEARELICILQTEAAKAA